MALTKHKKLNQWIDEMRKLCEPDKVVLLEGSTSEKKRLEKLAFETGELLALDPEKFPGCVFHRSAQNDVARTEHLTFICSRKKENAGPTNNWMSPPEAYAKARGIFQGAMKGRTMFVIPFSMGLPESPFSKIGVQLTDSIYVAVNMRLMTHMGKKALARLGTKGDFTKCLHSKAELDINRRMILHFPEDNTIWSVGSGYGGNALLGKKCLSLRMGSVLGQKEGWLAEHMLIMGIEDPRGEISYVAAAFPSACGKTNLAMLLPPEEFKKKGYKVWTLGDDIAWLRVDREGNLRAMNPEAGCFGVAPGTNSQTNPNAVASIRKNSVFTNVLLTEDKKVWWEGGDGPAPAKGINWKGDPWSAGQMDANGKPVLGAHPNSRFTAPITQCPSFSRHYYDPEGVKISAVIFGGRRSSLTPLVYEARNWGHGVYMGATMTSEKTAAQEGKQGEVRFDPMAMIPFCGYNMGDYFAHWLNMGERLSHPPRIFNVNWFRRDESGKFVWPGYGENFRVLLWIINRSRYQVAAREIPIGYIPFKEDLNIASLGLSDSQWLKLFSINPEEWLKEIDNQESFFQNFGDHLPGRLTEEKNQLKKRFLDNHYSPLPASTSRERDISSVLS